jgi:hypothetical protein
LETLTSVIGSPKPPIQLSKKKRFIMQKSIADLYMINP